MRVEKLLENLVSIRSVSGEEKQIGEYLVNLLEEDFEIELQKVEDGRFNVFAKRGEPETVFTTHLDTVEGDAEPLTKDGKMFGRGSCDAKTSMAAMIEAARSMESDVWLVFNVGEEEDFCGIKKILEKDFGPDKIILGEPTGLERIVAQKGLLTLKLFEKGKKSHGSKPSQGENAIESLFEKVQKMKDLCTENKVFGDTRFNLSKISGGHAVNVVPEKSGATVQIRTVDRNQRFIDYLEEENMGFEVLNSYSPVKLSEKKGIVFPGFTEAYFWSEISDDVMVMGPGEMRYAHSEDERMDLEQLNKAVKRYKTYLK